MEYTQNDLYKIAMKRLHNIQDCQDAIQDTYMSAYENLSSLDNNCKFKSWLISILINKCNTIYNSYKKIDELPEDIMIFDEKLDNIHDEIDFNNIIKPLKEKDQKIFKLRFAHDLSVKQISKVLDENTNTIKSKLSRGTKKLSKLSKKYATILFILLVFIATGVIAGCIISYIQSLFETKSVGIYNDGVSIAIENLDWFQEVNTGYVDLGNGYKIDIEYMLIDEMNLYLLLNFESNEDISNYDDIAITDLQIMNENGDIICNKNDMFAKQYMKKIGDKLIEHDKNHMKFLLYMYTDQFPHSQSLNINFSKIKLSKKSTFNNNYYLDIDAQVNLSIDLDEKFINRSYTSYDCENINIKKSIITETGFYTIVTIENSSKKDKVILIDENNNLYNCYITTLTNIDTSAKTEYIVISNLTDATIQKLKLKINNTEYELKKKV